MVFEARRDPKLDNMLLDLEGHVNLSAFRMWKDGSAGVNKTQPLIRQATLFTCPIYIF